MKTGLRFSRAELFWCAFLWLAHQWHREQLARLNAELDAALGEWAEKVSALMTRPSPILARMKP